MRSRKDRFPLLRVLPQALQVYTKYNKPPASLLANAGAIIGTDPMKTLANNAPWLLLSFVLLGAALYSGNAQAETSIHAGGLSYHVATGHKADYNSNHKLLAVEHNGFLVGRFSNSYDRTTAIAAYGWSKQWGNWRGAVYVGAVRGYRSCFGDDGDKAVVCPVAFPSLHYTAWMVQPGVLVLGEAVALTVRVAL